MIDTVLRYFLAFLALGGLVWTRMHCYLQLGPPRYHWYWNWCNRLALDGLDWSLSFRIRDNIWHNLFSLRCQECRRWMLGCDDHWFCELCQHCQDICHLLDDLGPEIDPDGVAEYRDLLIDMGAHERLIKIATDLHRAVTQRNSHKDAV